MKSNEYRWERYQICNFAYVSDDEDFDRFGDPDKEFLKELVNKRKFRRGSVALFPFFEDYIISPQLTLFPPLLDIESNPIKIMSDFNIIKQVSRKTPKYPIENQNMYATFLIQANSFMLWSDWWDDRYLFRFYAINEFCVSDENISLSEFINKNMEELYRNFRIGIGTLSKYTEMLLNLEKGHGFLFYMDETMNERISVLTRNEILSTLSKGENYYNDWTLYAYVSESKVDEIIIDAKSGNTHKPIAELYYEITEITKKSFAHYGMGFLCNYEVEMNNLMAEINSSYSSSNTGMETNQKLEILKTLSRFSENLQSYEVIAFSFIVLNPRVVFRSEREKTDLSNLRSILQHENCVPEEFVSFMVEAYLSYDDIFACSADFLNFLEEDGSFTKSVPPSLLIPMISTNKSVRGRRRSSQFANGRLFVLKMQTLFSDFKDLVTVER